jgi:hypothetical protein
MFELPPDGAQCTDRWRFESSQTSQTPEEDFNQVFRTANGVYDCLIFSGSLFNRGLAHNHQNSLRSE